MLVIRGAYIRGGLYSGGGLHSGFYGMLAAYSYFLELRWLIKGKIFENFFKLRAI